MIAINRVLEIHSLLINKFGGREGIRDLAGLEAALSRPMATFGGNDLYPDFLSKAAALAESLIQNHPFVDGNKRTGWTVLRFFLNKNGISIIADQDSCYDFVVKIASGELKFDEILQWLKNNTQSL